MILISTSKYLDFLSKFGVGGAHPGGIELTKKLFENENINESSRILDVGCGTGQTAAFLAAQYGASVTGIDINPTMIEKAKQRMAAYQLPVELIQGSIEDCPLEEDNYYDFIISESVLSFVNKPRALKEIYRLLKPDGRFIANELTMIIELDANFQEEIKQFYGFDSILMEKDWIALLEQAGFHNIETGVEKQALHENHSLPEFHHSENIEPDFYEVIFQHFNLVGKYQSGLDYSIFICNK